MNLKISSTLIFLIIFNIAISESVITFAQSNSSDQSQEQKQSQQIFGIRWFLGDYFIFHLPDTPPASQQMFVLMFNSEEELDDQIYLKIDGTRYGCYERFLEIQSVGEHHYEHNKEASKEGENFTNALYRCIVYAQSFRGLAEVDYQIVSGWTIFEGEGNKTVIAKHRQYSLFQGKLRIPQNMQKLKFFFLADWGLISPQTQTKKGYKDILPSMLKTVKDNNEVGLMIFGGDLAYDFEGIMYIKMLKYLQPITSCIPTLITPGNHESVYHEDSLELYVESFYSPMWYKYFNYFSLVSIESHKLVIVSYDPQNYVFPWVNRLGKDLASVFETELPSNVTSHIKENYDMMAFSHYPLHCSQRGQHYKTCEQNQNRFSPFTKKFSQMGMDIYLSGHLHIYERTKPLCSETDFRHNDQNIYNKECPVYVVEGDAGNDDWVEMTKRYEKKEFSQVIGFGTGYGLVTVESRNLTYEHVHVYDKENSSVTDKFLLYEPQVPPKNQSNFNKEQQKNIQIIQERLIVGLQVVALVVVAGLTVCLLYKLRKNRKNPSSQTNTQHVEMIEEVFETPSNNKKDMSKDSQTIE